jgi:hypothetical protein
MALKIGKILDSLILKEEGGNEPLFIEYAPVYILNEPTVVDFKLSTVEDKELKGTIESLPSDHEKLSKGQILNIYTFKLKIGAEERIIQLSGKQVNSEKNHGSPTLYKNVQYDFVSGESLVDSNNETNESFIIEADNVTGFIIFTNFDITSQQIDDSVDDMSDENPLDVSDITPDEEQKMNDLAFLLYGKDVGRLLPRYSKKYPGISKMFGLFKKGGYDTSLEKSKEKWGVSRFDFSGTDPDIRSMKNLPMFNVQFETPLNYDDGEGNKLKINKDDILKFNYDKNNKVLIHRISKKVNTNISQIYLKMDRTPELGGEYNTRLIKLVPKSGQIFDVETNKGYGAKIKLVEPTKK